MGRDLSTLLQNILLHFVRHGKRSWLVQPYRPILVGSGLKAIAFAIPDRSRLDKLMRYKPPLSLGELAEIMDSKSGYLRLLFGGHLPYYNR